MAFNPGNIPDENLFWLQILGDHSRFILLGLSPQETSEIEKARSLIALFDELLAKARRQLSGNTGQITEQAYAAAQDLRAFKLHLLSRHLTQKIQLDLPPVFLNHMINELDEYLYILESHRQKRTASFHPVHLHLVWLLDGYGHAQTIADRLESDYKDWRAIAEKFAVSFNNEHSKALEMRGFLRTGLEDFPSLDQMNLKAENEMMKFMAFLETLEKQVRDKSILSILQPLMLDHMYREECYYLSQLSHAANTRKPDCDPGRPRKE